MSGKRNRASGLQVQGLHPLGDRQRRSDLQDCGLTLPAKITVDDHHMLHWKKHER